MLTQVKQINCQMMQKSCLKTRRSSRRITRRNMIIFILLFLCGAEGARVVGGRDAAPHSHPYMASLQVRGRHNCGGVLISQDVVLTAAHCRIRGSYTVVVGVDSLRSAGATRQQRTSVRSIPHPAYDRHQNDVMLLKLDREVQLNSAVQVIPLGTGSIGASSRCLTAGWGDIGDNNTPPDTLQEVNVTVLPLNTCRSRWRGVRITGTMICGTGSRNIQGFCSGDSGGPLICEGASAGVVSFSGRTCGDQRTPDVYTRTSSYEDWITRVLAEMDR